MPNIDKRSLSTFDIQAELAALISREYAALVGHLLTEERLAHTLLRIGQRVMRSAGRDPEDLDVEVQFRAPLLRDSDG